MTTRRRLLHSLAAGTGLLGLPGSGRAAETGGVRPVPGRDPIDDTSQEYPLHVVPARNLSVVHGTALVAPSGERTILLVSDERAQRARLEILLPETLRARRWERVTTDRVRLQQPLPAIEPADPAKLPVVVNPMSLTVLTAPALGRRGVLPFAA